MIAIKELVEKFPKRPANSHKGDYGHVFVLAGSYGYTGAAYLASQAALLSGSGLVTLGVGKSIYPVLASKMTEVMVRPFVETKDASLSLLAEKEIINFAEKCNAIAIGPGISQNKDTQALIRDIITKLSKPAVLDADGINALTGNVDILKKVKSPLVMTPHPGEFSRLIGVDIQEIQKNRKDIASKFASEYNIVLVLKGHDTIVARPDGAFYINNTGNAGMATGGSGDVLTGIIASFIGQGMEAFGASVLAVYCHGLAGDLAVKEKGALSLIATDLLNKVPEVLKREIPLA